MAIKILDTTLNPLDLALRLGLPHMPRRGRSRLIHYLYPFLPRCARAEVIVKQDVCFFMYLDLRGWVGRSLRYLGEYDVEEVNLCSSIIQPGWCVLDIGANVGYYSLLAASLVGPTGRVIAVEPNPVTFQSLVGNVAINSFSNIEPVNEGLAEKAGTTVLHVDASDLGSCSFSKAVHVYGGQVEITVSTPSDLLKRLAVDHVDLIKLDVEGSEVQIIRGLSELLRIQTAPDIMFEINARCLAGMGTSPDELRKLLRLLGYSIYSITRKGLTADDQGQGNYYAAKRCLSAIQE